MTVHNLRKTLVFCTFCLLGLMAIGSAYAKEADRDKPINLEADRVTLDDLKKVGVYQGNVILSQGTMLLRADRVEVSQGDNGIKTVVATGNPVSFREKRDGVDEYVEAYAQRVEFDNAKHLLILSGSAILRKGEDEIRGDQITYNTETEFYKVAGEANAHHPAGRVHITIQPKSRNPK
jgi:lipopolysaccharide export system protein LptA